MADEETCEDCGGPHLRADCPREASRIPDVVLEELFSGRRDKVLLRTEEMRSDRRSDRDSDLHLRPTVTAGEAFRPVEPASTLGVVSLDTLITHPDPFISSLASQLRARDSLLEAVRKAAQQAVDQTRRRERELDDRESRVRDLSEELRSRTEEISRREAALEERVTKVDREIGERMRTVREREVHIERRESELAAAREAFEQELREREMEIASQEDRLHDIESFGRSGGHPSEGGSSPITLRVETPEVHLPVSFADAPGEQAPVQPEFVGMTASAKARESPAAELIRLRSDLQRGRARLSEREDSMVRKERELEDLALLLAEREVRLHEAEKKWASREIRTAARES